MSSLLAILLGLLQGITEFLPISSSGHLKLVEMAAGLSDLDSYLIFDVACHLGTCLAVIVAFRRELFNLLRDRRELARLSIGTLPLFFLVPLAKTVSSVYADPRLLGFFFLITATLLYLSEARPITAQERRSFAQVLVVGGLQVLAVLPGVSRSGSTIAGGRLMGWNREEAARFSFLLSIPAVLGSVVVLLFQAGRGHINCAPLPFHVYLLGFLTSLVAGYATLTLFVRLLKQHTLKPFAWYCLAIGLLALIVTNLA